MDKMRKEWIKSENENKPFTCTLCSKCFVRQDAVLRHINQAHKNTLNYECSVCGSKYKSKYALKRHIETNYLGSLPHRCTICEASFRLRNQLYRHIEKDHTDARSFKCTQCFSTFKVKRDLQRHVTRIHNVQNDENSPRFSKGLTCVICRKAFARKSMILFHLEKEHDVRLAFETHHFANIEEFYKWKNEIEKNVVCQYIKLRCDKNKQCKILSFVCHRSGAYVPHAKKNMRRLKLQGSKKMNGFCPAEMSLRQDNESGSCVLTYLKTHVGHPTGDETELAHVYLNKEEKRCVAEKIAIGTSFDEIINDFCTNTETDKLRLLENHTLHNIAASYNLKAPGRTKKFTPTKSDVSKVSPFKSVDEFILKNSNSVLYYKKEDELDDMFPCLRIEDNIIVIMSETQRSTVQKFGSNAIAIGGFYNDENCDFYIQILLTVDNYSEAFLCAFAISNRGEDDIVDIFIRCIRENTDMLLPNCLITDIRDVFHRSWSQTMNPPKNWLLSSWHVKEALKNQLQYVSSKEKQRLLKEKLDDLCTEPDVHVFHMKVNKFFDTEDVDTEHFFDYFRHNFVKNIHLWAHCYRLNVDSNANVYMKSFHNVIQYLHGKCKRSQNFGDFLDIFEKYSQFRERLLKIKEIRGCLSEKLRSLRKRHDSALKNTAKVNYSMEKSETGDWVLYSHSLANDENVIELFSVQCINSDGCPISSDCKLICEKCEVCAHQYKCSCNDSSIKNNMCFHVHTICLHIKNSKNTNSNEEFLPLQMNSTNSESANQVEFNENDSSHLADDFSKEILNSPRRARTLSECIPTTDSTSFSASVSNEFDSSNLNEFEKISFCDVIEFSYL